MSADTAPAAGFVAVGWNPVIDAAWWAKEMAALRAALGARFPHAAAETIDTAVDTATARVAVGARIPNYLPVLVGREAREWLRRRPDGT
jgi:hypothetical protein